jgi:hypothetical protein
LLSIRISENASAGAARNQWKIDGRLFPTNSAYAAASNQLIPPTG